MSKQDLSTTNSLFQNFGHKYLWLLILSYSMVIAISNWFDSRLILLFDMSISPGALAFPFTFLISDIITEVYGYKHARKTIWAALVFNFIFLLYGLIIINMPSPSYAMINDAYKQILTLNAQIVLGSFVAYMTSEPLNSYLMAKLKCLTEGRYMALRFIVSTISASGIDSFLFGFIAFYGVIENSHILELAINIWIVKSAVEIIFFPISTRICKYIKMKEQTDIYDYDTKFSIFRFDTFYKKECNKFNKDKK